MGNGGISLCFPDLKLNRAAISPAGKHTGTNNSSPVLFPDWDSSTGRKLAPPPLHHGFNPNWGSLCLTRVRGGTGNSVHKTPNILSAPIRSRKEFLERVFGEVKQKSD